MSGKLIVIEGLDGSGKATQTKLLAQVLENLGKNVKQVTFPNYDSPACEPVKMYLRGEFGAHAQDVNAYAASVLYTVDRFAAYKSAWGSFYEQGGIVLSDRYTTSNAIHQCSKLPQEMWDEYLNWLFTLEYEQVKIPTPDMVIYLQVEPEVSQKLMSKRYEGDESKKDIHEKDISHLINAQKAASYCANKLNWKTINCVENGQMRTIEDIHAEILKLAEQVINML